MNQFGMLTLAEDLRLILVKISKLATFTGHNSLENVGGRAWLHRIQIRDGCLVSLFYRLSLIIIFTNFVYFISGNTTNLTKIHVKFLADYRRAWIRMQKLLPFVELKEFQKNIKQTLNTKRKLFCEAVTEAENFIKLEINARLEQLDRIEAEKLNVIKVKSETRVESHDEAVASPAYEDITSEQEQKILKNEIRNTVRTKSLPSTKNLNNDRRAKEDSLKKKVNTLRVDNPELYVREMFISEKFTINNLMKLKRGEVCRHCYKQNNLTKCDSVCKQYYHRECNELLRSGNDIQRNTEKNSGVNETLSPQVATDRSSTQEIAMETGEEMTESTSNVSEIFCCFNCDLFSSEFCFICKTDDQVELIKCRYIGCGKFYHKKCLSYFPKVNHDYDRFICSTHFCHTCYSKDCVDTSTVTDRRLAKCVLCPSSYHLNVECLPAGAEFITATRIFCTDHNPKPGTKVNVNWCFICGDLGGNLTCCDTCPVALHESCLNLKITDDKYICDICESGR